MENISGLQCLSYLTVVMGIVIFYLLAIVYFVWNKFPHLHAGFN